VCALFTRRCCPSSSACAALALRAAALAVRPRAGGRGARTSSRAMATAAAAGAATTPRAYAVAPLAPRHVPAASKLLEHAFGYDSEYSWSRPLRLPRGRFILWLEHMYLPARATGALPLATLPMRAQTHAC
jgi:hypothetical protein